MRTDAISSPWESRRAFFAGLPLVVWIFLSLVLGGFRSLAFAFHRPQDPGELDP
jgi:hypothetical protein